MCGAGVVVSRSSRLSEHGDAAPCSNVRVSGDKSVIDDVTAAFGWVAGAIGKAVLAVDGIVDDLLDRAQEVAASGPSRATYDGVVLGVDACRAGWVGVVLDGETATAIVGATIGDLVTAARLAHPDLAVVGIDIPIGLPDAAPRRADVLARTRLPSGRKSSVFPAPTRAASAAPTHPEASAANREAAGVGLSVQAFRLVPKILEVDAYVRSPKSWRIVEVHPEVSFAAMDPGCVVASKRTPAGHQARQDALRAAGVTPPPYIARQGYSADDLLDGCAAAWSARRVAAGVAESLPEPPEIFSDGLPAAIHV
jgi:predicted RNase H-like nuclease